MKNAPEDAVQKERSYLSSVLVGFGQESEEVADIQFTPDGSGADGVGLDPLCKCTGDVAEIAHHFGDRGEESGDVRLADGSKLFVDGGNQENMCQRVENGADRGVSVGELVDK